MRTRSAVDGVEGLTQVVRGDIIGCVGSDVESLRRGLGQQVTRLEVVIAAIMVIYGMIWIALH